MNFLDFVLFVILVFLLAGSIFGVWYVLPGQTNQFEEFSAEINFSGLPEQSNQFYPNMRYPDKRISYNIADSCGQGKRENAEGAFRILQEKTILEFYEKEDGEIKVLCSDIAPEAEDEGHFVAGEGGPTDIINASLFNVIFSGQVALYKDEKCDSPKVAVHEILHALGFNHNNNKESIMYPVSDCSQEIEDDIINYINEIYSIPGNADLIIKEVNYSKSGRYLNFRINVMNLGLRDAQSAQLFVYADSSKIKDFDLKSIKRDLYVDTGANLLKNVATIASSLYMSALMTSMGIASQSVAENANNVASEVIETSKDFIMDNLKRKEKVKEALDRLKKDIVAYIRTEMTIQIQNQLNK
jgi:hypothetical protein